MTIDFNTNQYSIKQLKDICLTEPSWAYVKELQQDHRIGVQKLAQKITKILNAQERNKNNIKKLIENQQNLCNEMGITKVAGVDEVGRGPVAGPVVACAVLLPDDIVNEPNITKLDDSKKMSEQEREIVVRELTNQVYYSIGVVDVKTIDYININNAVDLAMEKAVLKLPVNYEGVLVDGNRVPKNIKVMSKAIPSGDGNIASISAASIIAKVYRDNIMKTLHNKFPQYNFNSNNGYGTAAHMTAINKYGSTKVHRKSFLN